MLFGEQVSVGIFPYRFLAILCGWTRHKERGGWGKNRINIRRYPLLFAGLTEIASFMLYYKIKYRTAFTPAKIIVDPMSIMASHHSDLAVIFSSSKHCTRLARLIAVKPAVAVRMIENCFFNYLIEYRKI